MTRQSPEKVPWGEISEEFLAKAKQVLRTLKETRAFSAEVSSCDANADLPQKRQKVVILVPKVGARCVAWTTNKSYMQYLAI